MQVFISIIDGNPKLASTNTADSRQKLRDNTAPYSPIKFETKSTLVQTSAANEMEVDTPIPTSNPNNKPLE